MCGDTKARAHMEPADLLLIILGQNLPDYLWFNGFNKKRIYFTVGLKKLFIHV